MTGLPTARPGPRPTGRLAFVAGQVALDLDGQLVGPGDLGAQTRQALGNL
ncbi:MAG: hypothetical protein M3140_03410 [Actinomycetota bacterium]|nr:hypothetical protein [Actinomycetota bacterium]